MENTKYTPQQAEQLFSEYLKLTHKPNLNDAGRIGPIWFDYQGDGVWWVSTDRLNDRLIDTYTLEGLVSRHLIDHTEYTPEQAEAFYQKFRQKVNRYDVFQEFTVGPLRLMYQGNDLWAAPVVNPLDATAPVQWPKLDRTVRKLLGLA